MQADPTCALGQQPRNMRKIASIAERISFSTRFGRSLISVFIKMIKCSCESGDPMHQIDVGVILHLLKAILMKINEVVEDILKKPGLAAAKLSARIRLMLKKTDGPNGQKGVFFTAYF